jgi:beta-phosphoglucomutase-like phosphatase (HAD superfamily)
MKSQRQTNLRGHGPISWETHLRIWERYAKRYGKSQSVERIEERYGFDMSEADMLYPEWREDEDLRDQLATAEKDTARVVDARQSNSYWRLGTKNNRLRERVEKLEKRLNEVLDSATGTADPMMSAVPTSVLEKLRAAIDDARKVE